MAKIRRDRDDMTVGKFEAKHHLPKGTMRNKDGRDTRSDKLLKNVRKGKPV